MDGQTMHAAMKHLGTILLFASLLLSAPPGRAEWLEVKLSAYCPCRRCTDGDGITASGAAFQAGKSLAAPSWIPFGTKVFVPSAGWRVVDDRMARWHRNKNHWDVGMATHRQAKESGVRTVRVWVAR